MDYSNLPSPEEVAVYVLRRVSRPDLVSKESLQIYRLLFQLRSGGGKLQQELAAEDERKERVTGPRNSISRRARKEPQQTPLRSQMEFRQVVRMSIEGIRRQVDVEFRHEIQDTLPRLRKNKPLREYLTAVIDQMLEHSREFEAVPGEQERMARLILQAALGKRHPLRSVKWLTALRQVLKGADLPTVAGELKVPEREVASRLRLTMRALRDFATEHDVTFPSAVDVFKLSANPSIRLYLRSTVKLVLQGYEAQNAPPPPVPAVMAPTPVPTPAPTATPAPAPQLPPGVMSLPPNWPLPGPPVPTLAPPPAPTRAPVPTPAPTPKPVVATEADTQVPWKLGVAFSLESNWKAQQEVTAAYQDVLYLVNEIFVRLENGRRQRLWQGFAPEAGDRGWHGWYLKEERTARFQSAIPNGISLRFLHEDWPHSVVLMRGFNDDYWVVLKGGRFNLRWRLCRSASPEMQKFLSFDIHEESQDQGFRFPRAGHTRVAYVIAKFLCDRQWPGRADIEGNAHHRAFEALRWD